MSGVSTCAGDDFWRGDIHGRRHDRGGEKNEYVLGEIYENQRSESLPSAL
jgi:hypothetical protein